MRCGAVFHVIWNQEREKMGINGRKAVMHYFEYGVLAQKFLEVMQ